VKSPLTRVVAPFRTSPAWIIPHDAFRLGDIGSFYEAEVCEGCSQHGVNETLNDLGSFSGLLPDTD